MLSLRI
jgi:hypothetical protein